MAVMVAPNRVDYSVGKGGLRSWAVLIVFVLLCSALLNIFSEEPEGIDGYFKGNCANKIRVGLKSGLAYAPLFYMEPSHQACME
jgi:hypothetical protein